MTTYVPFSPSAARAFQFSPTLDGATYTGVVTWNTFGQRWYLNLYDLGGNLVICTPLIGSPVGTDFDLVLDLFTSTLIYRESTATFEINP